MKPATTLARLIRQALVIVIAIVLPTFVSFVGAIRVGLIDPRFFLWMFASFMSSAALILALFKQQRHANVLGTSAACIFFLITAQQKPLAVLDGAEDVVRASVQEAVPAPTPEPAAVQPTPQPVRVVEVRPIVPEATPSPTPQPPEPNGGEDETWKTFRRYPTQ